MTLPEDKNARITTLVLGRHSYEVEIFLFFIYFSKILIPVVHVFYFFCPSSMFMDFVHKHLQTFVKKKKILPLFMKLVAILKIYVGTVIG